MEFNKIDSVFDWMIKNNVTGFSKGKMERGAGLDRDTVKKYKYELHTMYKNIQEWKLEYEGKKITDPTRIKQKDVLDYIDRGMEDYKNGNMSVAYHLHALDDAIHAFTSHAVSSGQFKYFSSLPKKEKIAEMLKVNKVYRVAAETTIFPNTRDEVKVVCDELRSMKTPAGEVAADALWAEFTSGRRISATLRHKAGNFNSENQTLISIGDKGNKTNFTGLTDEAAEHYAKLTEAKKDGTAVFSIKYKHGPKKGQDKSVEEMRKQVTSLINEACKRIKKKKGVEITVTSHGARKGFAQERATELLQKSKAELVKELDRIKAQDPKISRKIDNVLVNIKSKIKNDDYRNRREFTRKELVVLVTSCLINHSRLDVMRYYLTKDYWTKVRAEHPECLK